MKDDADTTTRPTYFVSNEVRIEATLVQASQNLSFGLKPTALKLT